MKVSLLYKIFISSGFVLLAVVFALGKLMPHRPSTAPELAPTHSPLTEIEFESGMTLKNLNQEQETRLHAYKGDPQRETFVEVPIDLAIDTYLKDQP